MSRFSCKVLRKGLHIVPEAALEALAAEKIPPYGECTGSCTKTSLRGIQFAIQNNWRDGELGDGRRLTTSAVIDIATISCDLRGHFGLSIRIEKYA
jgi:hypothetical protein